MDASSYILLDDQVTHRARLYTRPKDIIRADRPEEIEEAFARLADYHAQDYYLAGYTAYELGYTLEPKLVSLMPEGRDTPLLNFGVFDAPTDDIPQTFFYTTERPHLDLTPVWSEADYLARFNRVINYIKAGDTYQINLTFPLKGRYAGTAHTLYAALRQNQPGRYGGIIKLDNTAVISFSPELFFEKSGDVMSLKPMKGTRPRQRSTQADQAVQDEMKGDTKSQAENLMIVDLLRNDVSRISLPGSVKVPELFGVESYPTLHQMTSTITGTLKPQTSFRDIFKSLFPCGSVTGAPKIRAMEIIRELETTPRGAYCGATGFIDPNGRACFNVGIRTLTLRNGQVRYNIGSGVVLDSDGPDEYRECLLKSDVLSLPKPALIETLRWDSDTGYQRQNDHITRLKTAARSYKFPFSARPLKSALDLSVEQKNTPQRVRIIFSGKEEFRVEASDIPPLSPPVRIALSKYPLFESVQITGSKISDRRFYDGERARLKALTGVDEVIFVNQDGQLCEGSFTSLFIERQGQLLTPALSCGLLPGILRANMLASGEAVEAILYPEDLAQATTIYVGNSLRGLLPARLLSSEPQ